MLLRSWIAIFSLVVLQIQTTNLSAEEHGEEATIAYRLPENKTMHFDELQKASEHLEAVKKLGCEVAPAGHDGHNDVTYRCPKWKSLTVATDELAHQWEGWLEAAGFETLHGHEEEHEAGHESGEHHAEEHAHEHGEGHEEVKFRLANWVALTAQPGLDAEEMLTIAKALGCELQEAQFAGSAVTQIRCVEEKHLELPSHEAAEHWQQWLSKVGFEATHEDEEPIAVQK